MLLPAALGFDLALGLPTNVATNSSKYGSLSNSGGRVSLAWRLETAGAGSPRSSSTGTMTARARGRPSRRLPLGTGFGHRLNPRPRESANGAARSNRPRMTGFGYGCVWPCPPTSPTPLGGAMPAAILLALRCDVPILIPTEARRAASMRPGVGYCLLVILFVILLRSGVFGAGPRVRPIIRPCRWLGEQITVIGASET